MFLWCNSEEINSHVIHPDWLLTSDHVSLTITISIIEEHITTCKKTLIKNSVEEDNFVNEVIALFSKVDTSNISSISDLDEITLSWADIVDRSWSKHSKFINITKHLKSWWNDKCSQDLANYRVIKSIESWKTFHKTVKLTSTLAFDITQFFPSLNHHLLSLILDKAGFSPQVARFFSNYLVNRKTSYY